jgi:hypothetical protein
MLVKCQFAKTHPTTQTVAARAPHFVDRFQKSAASITGASAAKPEKAKRIASSKMLAFSFSAKAMT